jgi:hypothetical protein
LELSRIIIEGFITLVLSIRVKRLIKKNNEMNKRIKEELKKRDANDANGDQKKNDSAITILGHGLYDEFIYSCNEQDHLCKLDIPSFEEWLEYYKYCTSLPGGNVISIFRTKNRYKFYREWKSSQN